MFKKIILAALIVTSAAFADFFNVGARAAANFGTAWGNDADYAKWGVGFNAGVALKIDILPVITIIPGLEVDYRRIGEEENRSDGSSYEYVTDGTYGMWYLDVPVLARVNLIPMVYLNAGVQFSFNLSANFNFDETETYIKTGESEKRSDDISVSKLVNTMDIGLIVGAGVSLMDKLDIDFRLVLGLNSYRDENDEGYSMSVKHMRMQAGIIYWF
ncbi:MAG: PorT family protein [Fibrobacter sp.]|nr:PorT family protein [Fibrobacter sp.]